VTSLDIGGTKSGRTAGSACIGVSCLQADVDLPPAAILRAQTVCGTKPPLLRGSLITCRPSVKVDGSAAQPAARAAAESANSPSSHASARTYTAEPGSRSEEALKLLGSWAATVDSAELARAQAPT
jgi:hypothetical protein